MQSVEIERDTRHRQRNADSATRCTQTDKPRVNFHFLRNAVMLGFFLSLGFPKFFPTQILRVGQNLSRKFAGDTEAD